MKPAMKRAGMLLSCVLGASACEREPEVLEPYPQVMVVVDTDVDVESLADMLQIDVYLPQADGSAPAWIYSYRVLRDEAETWPVSFSLARDELDGQTDVLLRLRLFPDGKTRDNRGERFFEDESLASYVGSDDPGPDEALCPTFFDADRFTPVGVVTPLGDDGRPVPLEDGIAPADEPQPFVTIDRLARVRLDRGTFGTVNITLRGACFGVQADLFAQQSCIDGAVRRVILEDEPVDEQRVAPPSEASALVATFAARTTCEATPPGPRAGLYDDKVCIDGEAFLLGDPSVFGYQEFDAAPERVAVVSPFLFDRYEVTVGRFRAALDAGLLVGVPLPVVHDGPLAERDDLEPEHHCAFSSSPLADSREAHPLNCASFVTARAFCRAEGGDLPTEAQWELVAAAAGRSGQDAYPWGPEAPSCDRAVYGLDAPVGADPECKGAAGYGPQPEGAPTGDVTPGYGIVHMAGNVREWTLDAHRAYCSGCWALAPLVDPVCTVDGSRRRALRGGDWQSGADFLLSAIRDEGRDETEWDPRVGFRCVRNLEEGGSR
jgi:formylglycine-generating enzyme required for sulfatase activity